MCFANIKVRRFFSVAKSFVFSFCACARTIQFSYCMCVCVCAQTPPAVMSSIFSTTPPRGRTIHQIELYIGAYCVPPDKHHIVLNTVCAINFFFKEINIFTQHTCTLCSKCIHAYGSRYNSVVCLYINGRVCWTCGATTTDRRCIAWLRREKKRIDRYNTDIVCVRTNAEFHAYGITIKIWKSRRGAYIANNELKRLYASDAGAHAASYVRVYFLYIHTFIHHFCCIWILYKVIGITIRLLAGGIVHVSIEEISFEKKNPFCSGTCGIFLNTF